ncbi:TlpA family protein disulfide reductase [Robiginitalea aurantiaca]|uniref:Redoxin family protein n=1 Tax=Robiginitalea aurantiaca TaxID=3056915 RepID=A0ABT7WDP5_9FLAO|nr:redoxin family protein [Robiginitalea aurantiaca]MDM9631032.1 redoxin family protein [Robiginitalea aurantiaca]
MAFKNKNFLWLGIVLGVVALLIFGADYLEDTSYQGDDSIRFVASEYSDLEALLASEPFQNKVLYVDLWFSSCPPCIKEFKNPPLLKEHFKNRDDLVFLYISHRTLHPNALQLWKNAIRKYNLTGWHYMMDREFETRLWAELRSKDSSIAKGYPRYLIIDNSSGYRNYSAPQPSQVKEVKALLEPLLDR